MFIHATLWTHVAGDPQAPGERAFKYVTDLFSFNLGRVAVPAFFVLSGFFFFWSLDLNEYKFSWFFTQWKKRIRSLLVPYLIWNLLMVIAIFVKNALFIRMGFGADECYGYIRDMDVPEWFWGGPINYPLWYIRDLICLSLLAPLFYYLIRYVKWGSILAIFLVFFFRN